MNGLILAKAVTAFFFLQKIFDSAFFLTYFSRFFFSTLFSIFFLKKKHYHPLTFFWFFEKYWLPSAIFNHKNWRLWIRVFQDVPSMQPKKKYSLFYIFFLKKKSDFFPRFFWLILKNDKFWTYFGIYLRKIILYIFQNGKFLEIVTYDYIRRYITIFKKLNHIRQNILFALSLK